MSLQVCINRMLMFTEFQLSFAVTATTFWLLLKNTLTLTVNRIPSTYHHRLSYNLCYLYCFLVHKLLQVISVYRQIIVNLHLYRSDL